MLKNVEAKAKVLTDFHNHLSTAWATDATTDASPGCQELIVKVAVINVDTSKIGPRSGTCVQGR